MVSDEETVESIDRRHVLKGIGGASAGLVTAGAMSSPAAAGKGGDCDPDGDPARIDTSDHYDTTWYGSVYLTDGHAEDGYDEVGGDLPDEPDELVVHVHGWQNDEECGIARIQTASSTYDDAEYDHPVTGLTWDSSYAWWNAKEIAEKNADKLANFLTDYAEENSDTVIRVQSHSLGARVLAETLLVLDENDEDEVVSSAIFMGGAVNDESVSLDGKCGEAIENVTHHAENFWMEDDDVLEWAYETYEWSSAVGNAGCEGEQPANYTDHEITKDIGHSDYYKDEEILGQVTETFETPERYEGEDDE